MAMGAIAVTRRYRPEVRSEGESAMVLRPRRAWRILPFATPMLGRVNGHARDIQVTGV